jgi:putative ABC transport system ATP-binding protein
VLVITSAIFIAASDRAPIQRAGRRIGEVEAKVLAVVPVAAVVRRLTGGVTNDPDGSGSRRRRTAPGVAIGGVSMTRERTIDRAADVGTTTRSEAMVVLEHVSRQYRIGSNVVTALDDVNLSIDAGEFAVILGPSGSGKTTILNIIGALEVPTSGRLVIDGREITGASRRELFAYRRATVAFVFQTFNLFPGLTARENVEFGIDVARGRQDRRTAEQVLHDVGLGDRLDHFPNQLSGGEQQRVAIARALATGSRVLLADEPTGELDYRTGVQILELLRAQARAGACVIVVTHNREISRAGNRVIELSGGRVVSDAAPPGGPVPMQSLRW